MKNNQIRHFWQKGSFYIGFSLLFAVCIVFMFAEIYNDRFWLSDFEVYYKAAYRILHGQNLYQIAEDGHYVFKYSPTSSIFFIPFLIMPFAIAKYAYWIMLSASIVAGFYLIIKLIKPDLYAKSQIKTINTVVLLGTLILALHFLRELHLGQVNYLLLFLYLIAIYHYQKDRKLVTAILLASSVFIKPFGLIFIPYFLLKKDFRSLGYFLGSAVLLFLLPILFFNSIEITWQQYQLWIRELIVEMSHKQELLAPANHSIFSILARYSPIRFIALNATTTLIYQLAVLSLIGISFSWFTLIHRKRATVSQLKYLTIIEMILLTAYIPLLAFTSENAFVFTLPLVFIIMLNFDKMRGYQKLLAIVGFVFIGGNFGELWGPDLTKIIDSYSFISIGTLILIGLLYSLRLSKKLI